VTPGKPEGIDLLLMLIVAVVFTAIGALCVFGWVQL
jgi:hypothetical protein